MAQTAENPFEMKENQGQYYQPIDRNLVESFPQVFIFSLDPNPHLVGKGGLGDFLIPGKEPGERVSKALVIPGRYPSHMHLGTSMSPVHYEDGKLLANDIVGVLSADKGLGRHTSNLEWYGIFVSENEEPTKKEIEKAESMRRQFLERLVADADAKFMRGRSADIDAPERAAAHELKLKKAWADKPTAMEACPACGSSVMPHIAVCPNCRAVIDEAKARQYFPERFPKPEEEKPAKKA